MSFAKDKAVLRSHRKRNKEMTMNACYCVSNLLIWGFQEMSCGAARLRDVSVRGGKRRKEAMPASCYMSSCSLL